MALASRDLLCHPPCPMQIIWRKDFGMRLTWTGQVFSTVLNTVIPVQGKSGLLFSYENGKTIMELISAVDIE